MATFTIYKGTTKTSTNPRQSVKQGVLDDLINVATRPVQVSLCLLHFRSECLAIMARTILASVLLHELC